jgi:hypothetical protein
MKRLLLAASTIALLSLPAQTVRAGDDLTHRQRLELWAAVVATTAAAEKNCARVKTDSDRLTVSAIANGYDSESKEDIAIVLLALLDAEKMAKESLKKMGATQWCANARKAFGRNGVVLKNALIEE